MEKHEEQAIDICKNAKTMSLEEIEQAYDEIEFQFKAEALNIVNSVLGIYVQQEEARGKILNLLMYGK